MDLWKNKKEKNKIINKNKFLVLGMLILVLMASSFVSTRILTNNAGVEYEERILEEFANLKYSPNELKQPNETFIKIIITLKDKSKANEVFSTFSENEFFHVINRPISKSISVRITEEGFSKLIWDERVKSIYFNRPLYFSLNESIPLINADDVWNDLNYTGQGIKVCIIDSGVDKTHPDLFGKISAEKCYCENNCCSGGTNESGNATNDDTGHGTHIAGIIASQDNIYRGIAPNVSLYTVKVGGAVEAIESDVGDAITWCINQGVDIISISLGDNENHPGGSSCPTYINTEINNAYNAEIPVIISSGNQFYMDGTSYPACSANAISVGATTKQDEFADYTNRDNNLDLLAPGGEDGISTPPYSEIVSLYSPIVKGDSNLCAHWWIFLCWDFLYEVDTDYIRLSGTSMAAPHVAGAAALMLEKNSSLTPDEIKTILQDTGVSIWDPGTNSTYPRIDVAAAVAQVPFCNVSSWTAGSCGGGTCEDYQKQYTRTTDPLGCVFTSKCEYDSDCISPPSQEITVCASGCDYTTIQDALDNSNPVDVVSVTDNRSYSEYVQMDDTTAAQLVCVNGSTILGSGSGTGIELYGMDGFLVEGCRIYDFSMGIHIINSSFGDLIDLNIESNSQGIFIEDASQDNEIKNVNITDTASYGIDILPYEWGYCCGSSSLVDDSLIYNADEGIYQEYGLYNDFTNNNITENNYGIHLLGYNEDLHTDIINNLIHSNDVYGMWFEYSDYNALSNNTFCKSNSNTDIYVEYSSTLSGDGNSCEKPGGWNDDGTTGCTYSCDTPAEVDLLYPNDGSVYITKDSVDFVCQSSDNYQLSNVTLYHDITGTWHANQTINISGTSNITIFNILNIANGTNILWNCLAKDNRSRGNFADINWSVEVIIDTTSPTVNITSPLNKTYNVSSIDFNVTLNENGNCEYSINNGVTNVSMGSTDNQNFYAINSSMNDGSYTAIFYCEDVVNNMNNTESVSFTVYDFPTDTHKFNIKNSIGNVVAWLGSEGNIVLNGTCISGGTCTAPANSFIISNSTDNTTAYISSQGTLCIEKGDCSDQSSTCNPSRDAFIVQNSSSYNMSFIDYDGDLCLIGRLFENAGF